MSLLVIASILVLLWLYNLYANIIRNKNSLLEAKSGIDVQFQKRYDLIPNILTIAQKYMEHEKETFNRITELRTQAMNAKGTKNEMKLNAELDSALSGLMVSVENYPELKASETMVRAMQTYNEVEEHIAAARRFYNSALTQLRNSVMIFPGSLFQGCVVDVLNSEYYESSEIARKSVNAGDFLK